MTENTQKQLIRVELGRTNYADAWKMQKKLVDERVKGNLPDLLLLTEHDPVITKGRATDINNLLCSPDELKNRGVELFEIERGGDITYHGPGQLVIYPIIDLNNHGRDLHKYLRDLERMIIATLGELGIEAGVKPGLTGVWADDKKLAAIGVAVSRWITYHGAALNVNTDLDYYKLINPCGITQFPVGSIKNELGNDTKLDKVADLIIKNFADIFSCDVEQSAEIENLLNEPAEV